MTFFPNNVPFPLNKVTFFQFFVIKIWWIIQKIGEISCILNFKIEKKFPIFWVKKCRGIFLK
jgi:hypothetical protein